MDWRDITFDWNNAKAFYVTAEKGSLSAAAKALGLSQPTLGRQVRALEEELNVALFERFGKGLKLTPTGVTLFNQVKAMAEAASEFSLTAAGNEQDIAGIVRISATEMTAIYTLPAIIKAFSQQYPNIKIETLVSNESSDLRRREADIAIRAYRPEQPDLIIRRVKDLTFNLYASRDYVERHKTLFNTGRIHEADFVGFASGEEYIQILKQYFALDVSQQSFSAYTSNHILNWQLVKQGMGVSGMMCEVGDKDPEVVPILPEEQVVSGAVYLVSHRELRMNKRIKIVFDYFAKALSE